MQAFGDTFVGNLISVAGVHNVAYTYYTQHESEYDNALTQARINKTHLVMVNCLNTAVAGQGKHVAGQQRQVAILINLHSYCPQMFIISEA